MSTMESRFAHLRQRDSSVSMLRVRMSRRRSQSQKENRERVMNCRRQLDKLPELESSCLDASIMTVNMSTVEKKAPNNTKYVAATERMKQLERWKERKALEKEKEKREKERKGVFKTGLYQPKDTLAFGSLPQVPAATARAKEAKLKTVQATRITRSMKQQQQAQKPQKEQDRSIVMKKVEPVVERLTRSRVAVHPLPAPALTRNKASTETAVRALSTRSANRPPVAAVPLGKDQSKPKEKSAAETRVTRARANVKPAVPPSGREKNCKVQPAGPKEPEVKEPEQKACPASPTACEEEEEEEERMMVDQAPAEYVPSLDPTAPPCSFAPQGFVFQAPAGLSSFKFEPLTPRSADSFLTPSSSFNLPSVPPPCFDSEPQAGLSGPPAPKSPHHSPPHPSPTPASQTTASPQEPQHDVPYFRSEITNETDRLMSLCAHWESKVEDESIPEEMRDRMRTVVGQARLLMKERFNQFSGLVDDCELGRGEKITTCTDLQGFWDMVYYQVEDVHKKFDALKEAEARGWVEEHKPPPRQRKAVKKPPSATAAKPAGSSAAAKSRLAAVKAAMKARQQAVEAEKAAKVAVISEDGPDPGPQDQQAPALAPPPDTVVFNGGFFQIESPAKLPGSARRSSRLSAAVLPQASPCSSLTLTPGRITRRSTALSHASPAHLAHTPARLRQSPQPNTPQLSHNRRDTVNVSLSFSPVKEVSSDSMQPEELPENQLESATGQSETTSDCNEDANQPEYFTVPEPSSPVREQSLPTISVVQDQDGVPETTSASLPLSPFKPSSASSHVPRSPSTLRLTLSPCPANSQSPLSSPAVCSSPPAAQSPVEAHESRRTSPDSSINESVPGLDFERYFQPSQRLSLSLRDTVSSETLSPMAVDIEMESPTAQRGDLQTQEEEIMMPTALPGASTLTPQTHQAQIAESHLLLFTPDLKDRIRQSVCPSDLMVFTPPFNQ